MKKIILILFISILTGFKLLAQIQVDNTQTAEWYVKNILLGGGVTVSNVTFQGDLAQIGSFANGITTNIGLNNGLVLATGGISEVIGPNLASGKSISVINSIHSEPDIASMVTSSINDPAILEFDFIPKGDSLEFEYVFGSEEYPEFVNSSYNDVFGFFLSGPGINGTFLNNAQNIALIPGTTNFVSINNLNDKTNSQFYIDNTSGLTIEYDGFTTVLKAKAKIQPCQTYHIKLVIADLGDQAWDSGVFLKAGSFSSHGTGVSTKYSAKSGLEAAIEGCSDATIEFDAGYNVLQDTIISYSIGGIPQNGVDYQTLTGSLSILKGQKTGIIKIVAIEDSIPEPIENVDITFNIFDVCLGASTTTISIPITDAPLIKIPKNPFDCKATSITPNVIGNGKYQWYTDNVGGLLLGSSIASNSTINPIDLADITDVTGVSPNRIYKIWVEERDDKSFVIRKDKTKFSFSTAVYKDANLVENVLNFNVLSGFIFDGLDVSYRCLSSSGTLTIHIYDANGIDVGSNTVTVSNTTSSILSFTGLNISLPTGNNYSVGFTGTDVEILWASTGTTSAYPYDFKYYNQKMISILGPQSTIKSSYPYSSPYLFNWNVRKSFMKDNLCDRVPVLITETCKACEKPLSLSISQGQQVSICENDSLKLNVVYTLGKSQNGGYYYSWYKSGVLLSNDQQYNSLTVNKTTGSGNYSIRIEDGNVGNSSCYLDTAIIVTVNALPTITAQSQTICFGESTKLVGSGANSYVWSGGITDNTNFSPTITTTYQVTGTDGNSCKNTANANVTVNALPTITVQLPTICYGESTKLVGQGASTYVWSGGITDNVSFSPSSTTTYIVTGTDGNNCSNTTSAKVTVNALPSVTVISPTICIGESIKLKGKGASTYIWDGGINDNVSFNPITTTTYIVTGTDGNNCSNTASSTVTVNALPTITAQSQTICFGESIKLVGSGANTYVWSGGITNNTNFSPTTTTTFQVTGTDGNSCKNTANASVTVNALPTISVQLPTICYGESTKLIGQGASTYVWSGGITDNVSFSPSATTTYIVTGTDGNNCSNTASSTVTVNALPTITAQSQTICFGESTKLVGSGANSYVWSGGITDNTNFSPATTTTYQVTGTDGNSCKNTANASVTVNALPTISVQLPTICYGESTKLIGVGANTYVWSGGITDNVSFSPSATTTYIVTGTDGNNCSNTTSAKVTVNTLPSVTAISPAICIGESIKLKGKGASTYVWDGGITDNVSFNPITTTTYQVTGTDGNNCSNTASSTVTVNALPTITAQSQTICFGESTKLVGSGANSYVWSGGITDNTNFSPTTTTTYQVTGTDANKCSNTGTASVIVNPLPTISALSKVICMGESTQLNGNGAQTYKWSGNIVDNMLFTPLYTAVYSVTGTDVNGCNNTGITKVTVNSLPTINAKSQSICKGQYTKLEGLGAFSYDWSDGVFNAISFSPEQTTIYQVTGTDNNGCKNTSTATVNVNPNPFNKIIGDTLLCENTTKKIFKVLNMTPGSTYSWSVTGGRTNYIINEKEQYYRSFDFIESGIDTIYVTETNKYNCVNTDSIVVRVTHKPNVGFTISKDDKYEFINNTDSLYIIDGNYKELIPMSFSWSFGREIDTTIYQTWEEYLDQKVYNENYDFGTYQITLSANPINYECSENLSKEISVDITKALYIPTSFVPTSSAPNLNTFMAKGYNLMTYKMWIYDIWGNLLWYTDKLENGKPSDGWDGTYNGKIEKMDCYIWKVEAEFLDGQKWKGSSRDRFKGGYTFGSVLLLQ